MTEAQRVSMTLQGFNRRASLIEREVEVIETFAHKLASLQEENVYLLQRDLGFPVRVALDQAEHTIDRAIERIQYRAKEILREKSLDLKAVPSEDADGGYFPAWRLERLNQLGDLS